VTISFIMFAYLSVRMEQLGYHWTDFQEIWYLSIFWKSMKKIQIPIKSDMNNRYLHEDKYIYFLLYLAQFFLEWEMFQIKVTKKIKTCTSCSIMLLQKSSHLWDNVGKHGATREATGDNLIWCMWIACWLNKVTDTYLEYVILIAFPWQHWCLNVTFIYTLTVLFDKGLFATNKYLLAFLVPFPHFNLMYLCIYNSSSFFLLL